MLKILQARLQQYMNHELPDVQAGFRKGRGTRDQIANIRWMTENEREFQKNIYALNMPANLENSAVATGLEKVSFHSNPKERQCQRMLKLLPNCTHLIR